MEPQARKRWGGALRRFSHLVPRKRRTAVLREGRSVEWRPRLVLEELLGHDLRAWFSRKRWGAALRRPPLAPLWVALRRFSPIVEGRQVVWQPLLVLARLA